MVRAFCFVLAALVCGSLYAAKQPSPEKEVAIIHFNQLKDGKIEGTAKDITLKPITGNPGQTSYIALVNDLNEPKEITVRILDLTEPEYDLYVDGNLAGVKKREQLEAGIPVSFSGTDIPPNLRDYYTRLKKDSAKGEKNIGFADDKESMVCRSIARAVGDWVESIERGDMLIRTTTVIVVPTGSPLSLPGGRYIMTKPVDFPKSVKHLGEAVHLIRGEVIRRTRNLLVSQEALMYITPIYLELTSSSPISPNSKITVTAKVTNWTDRNAAGKVELILPDGWKARSLSKIDINLPGYSKTAEVKFEVIIPANIKADDNITANADLSVEDIPLKLVSVIKGSKNGEPEIGQNSEAK